MTNWPYTISFSCLDTPHRHSARGMVPLMLILDVLVVVLSLAAFLAIRDYQIRGGLLYPPGPRPLPLIGNLIDIPKEFSWLTYTHLSKKYGMSRSLLWVLLTEQIPGISYHSVSLARSSSYLIP